MTRLALVVSVLMGLAACSPDGASLRVQMGSSSRSALRAMPGVTKAQAQLDVQCNDGRTSTIRQTVDISADDGFEMSGLMACGGAKLTLTLSAIYEGEPVVLVFHGEGHGVLASGAIVDVTMGDYYQWFGEIDISKSMGSSCQLDDDVGNHHVSVEVNAEPTRVSVPVSPSAATNTYSITCKNDDGISWSGSADLGTGAGIRAGVSPDEPVYPPPSGGNGPGGDGDTGGDHGSGGDGDLGGGGVPGGDGDVGGDSDTGGGGDFGGDGDIGGDDDTGGDGDIGGGDDTGGDSDIGGGDDTGGDSDIGGDDDTGGGGIIGGDDDTGGGGDLGGDSDAGGGGDTDVPQNDAACYGDSSLATSIFFADKAGIFVAGAATAPGWSDAPASFSDQDTGGWSIALQRPHTNDVYFVYPDHGLLVRTATAAEGDMVRRAVTESPIDPVADYATNIGANWSALAFHPDEQTLFGCDATTGGLYSVNLSGSYLEPPWCSGLPSLVTQLPWNVLPTTDSVVLSVRSDGTNTWLIAAEPRGVLSASTVTAYPIDGPAAVGSPVSFGIDAGVDFTSAAFSPDGAVFFAGKSKSFSIFVLDYLNGTTPQSLGSYVLKLATGHQPRIVAHPNGKVVYVLDGDAGTVAAYTYDRDLGTSQSSSLTSLPGGKSYAGIGVTDDIMWVGSAQGQGKGSTNCQVSFVSIVNPTTPQVCSAPVNVDCNDLSFGLATYSPGVTCTP